MNRQITTKHRLRGVLALLTSLLLLLPCLAACNTRAIPAGELALTTVGKVGDREITYEELYFLCENYKDELDASRGAGNYTAEDIKALVWEHIVTYPVMLKVCEEAGLLYDEKELRDEVNNTIRDQFLEMHGDNRDNYLEWLSATSMTDHYYRYALGVNILYGKLQAAYVEKGILPSDDAGMLAYVKENFVNTRHVAIFFDETNRAEKLQKAQKALDQYARGEKTMNGLIGSFSEEIGLATEPSYYMAKGSMEQAYADAVLALKAGEVSDIVESRGINMQGLESDCFYIIERMEMKDSEILQKLDDLRADAADALAYEKDQTLRKTLTFVPTPFAQSLDLLALEAPDTGRDPLILWIPVGIVIALVAVGGITAGVILLHKRKTNKKPS